MKSESCSGNLSAKLYARELVLSLRLLNVCCFRVVDHMLSSALIWQSASYLSGRCLTCVCICTPKTGPNVVCLVCSDWLPTMALDQSHKSLSGDVWWAVNVRFRMLFLLISLLECIKLPGALMYVYVSVCVYLSVYLSVCVSVCVKLKWMMRILGMVLEFFSMKFNKSSRKVCWKSQSKCIKMVRSIKVCVGLCPFDVPCSPKRSVTPLP